MSRRGPALLRQPVFVRLWLAGGIGTAVLWLEVLAAGLFTLQVTHSGLAVAIVSAARSLPLLAGALVGALSESLDRKRIVLGGLLLAALSSGTIAALGFAGLAKPWHLGLAALASGCVYATEMPARRRMIAESAGPARIGAAVAADSLTNFATRCAGPLIGGAAYGAFGLGGTYALSAAASLVGALLVAPLPRGDGGGPVSLAALRDDLVEGLRFARASAAMRSLLGVTITMNLFGYAYTALVAPIGREAFGLTPAWVGVLAAAEPAGALLGGVAMTLGVLPGTSLGWLAGGVAMLLTALGLVRWLPPLWPVCAVLLLGGLGSALFTNYQTTIVMTAAPPALRSRAFGLVTVCIGTWPLGVLLAGALTLFLPPLAALATMAWSGLAMLAAVLSAAGCRPGASAYRRNR